MLTVATWNVENLFPPGDDGPSAADVETKLTALVDTITAAEVDVLAVQEIGSPPAFELLRDRLTGQWQGAVSSQPDARGIRVGVLARRPIDNPVEVIAVPSQLSGTRVGDDGAVITEMGRGAIQVDVDAPGGPVTFLTCHLKSKLLTYPGGRFFPADEDQRARYGAYALNRRTVEAATVRIQANAFLDNKGRQRRLVVLGDLNDTVDAATTQILLGPGGSEIGTAGQDRPDAGDGSRLWNVAPLIPADRRASRTYRGRRELIDHVLVSHALLGLITDATTITAGGAPLPSITDNPNERPAAAPSDHAMVRVQLDL